MPHGLGVTQKENGVVDTRLPMSGSRKRAAVAVQILVASVMLIGFGALVIDVGMMYNTRADLQHAADAAALAGAAFYTSDQAMAIRMGTQTDASTIIRDRWNPFAGP